MLKRHREMVTELELVPLIDLMSVLIAFLLISAVWHQISMMQIESSIYGQRQSQEVPNIPKDRDSQKVLSVSVESKGYVLTFERDRILLPLKEGEYDIESLLQKLTQFKKGSLGKNDALLSMEDHLPYGELIRAMDQVLLAGFSQVSVVTGGL